jgi:hypothetical protein
VEVRVCRLAFVLVGLQALASVAVASSGSFADPAGTTPKPSHRTTYMYVGNQKKSSGTLAWGENQPGHGVLAWIIDGNCGYENGWAEMNPARTYVNIHEMDGSRPGFSRKVNAKQWAIYSLYPKRRLTGVAVQRSVSRWDVLRGGRSYGHTEGPWGPPAAAALVLLCA